MNKKSKYFIILNISWIISLTATIGSLLLSEYLNYPPCKLCWFQRVFMYPLTFLFLPGLIGADYKCILYTFPIIVVGFVISIFHNLLILGIIPKSFSTCSQGISCSIVYFKLFDFLSIPMLSLISFFLLLMLQILIYFKFYKKRDFDE